MRLENTQFLNTIASKEEEIVKLRELFSDTAKRNRARSITSKDVLKSKKHLRDKEQEVLKLTEQLRSQKFVIEDQRQKIDDLLNGRKPSATLLRPSQTGNSSLQNSLSYGGFERANTAGEETWKGKITQMEATLAEKVVALAKESQERMKF